MKILYLGSGALFSGLPTRAALAQQTPSPLSAHIGRHALFACRIYSRRRTIAALGARRLIFGGSTAPSVCI
ncbi:hypothetical protein [Nitrosomonas sp. Is79A3]|uniref:hypothetical protein n=1 Tax=Nitrosomonas sp. (strain Is79A3) TaxID=261292 RepID=UPI0002E6C972